MKGLVKNGLIAPTRQYETCGMTSRHAAPVAVYRSLIYKPVAS